MRFVHLLVAFGALMVPALAREPIEISNPPVFHFGGWLEVRPRAKIQLDVRDFRPELDDQQGVFLGRRLRIGVDGTLFTDFDYTVRVETRKAPEFRDVFLRYKRFRSFQVQAGRFKIPFGLDQLTDSGELDFVYRSRIGSIIAPGRDAGAVVSGVTREGAAGYSAGMFVHDGRNTEIEDFATNSATLPGGSRTIAARVVIKPAELLSIASPVHNLTVGAAFTHSDLETGLSSLPGVTVSNQVFFPRMYVSGNRMRRGAEIGGTLGLLSIKGEFMDSREQRHEQGLRGETLPSLRTQGWYANAVYPLIRRMDDSDQVGFLRSILPGHTLGVVEVAARYEVIRFGSVAGDPTAPSRNPRATNVVGNDYRAWTFGANWRASRYLRFQLNGVRETLADPARTPIDGKNRYWTLATRLQLHF